MVLIEIFYQAYMLATFDVEGKSKEELRAYSDRLDKHDKILINAAILDAAIFLIFAFVARLLTM